MDPSPAMPTSISRLTPTATSSGAFLMSTHDAIVRARLEELQGPLADTIDLEAPATRLRAGARPGPRQVSLRVRLGHRLTAIGAAIAGEDERTNARHAT